jgi:uncharacterized FAD-dependent dehydrogenase
MLRLTDVHLPLDHPEHALKEAVLDRLGIAADHLRGLHIFRRAFDARKKSAIQLVYTVDVEVDDEPALLLRRVPKLGPTPDLSYQFVAQAPARAGLRPVVIGFGPCGLFAAISAAPRVSVGLTTVEKQPFPELQSCLPTTLNFATSASQYAS